MTKEQAKKLAEQVAKAYGDGMLTWKHAKQQMERIARRYKQNENWKKMQSKNPATWVAANSLLSIVPKHRVSKKISYR